MRKFTAITLTAITLTGLTLGLTACSGSDAAPKPTSSSTPKAAAKPKTGVCDDGQLVITKKDLKNGAFTVDDPCKLVAVLTSDAKVTIGADIDGLSIEGTNNSVDAQTVGSVAVFGSGNTLSHTGATPAMADTGAGTPTDFSLVQK